MIQSNMFASAARARRAALQPLRIVGVRAIANSGSGDVWTSLCPAQACSGRTPRLPNSHFADWAYIIRYSIANSPSFVCLLMYGTAITEDVVPPQLMCRCITDPDSPTQPRRASGRAGVAHLHTANSPLRVPLLRSLGSDFLEVP